MSMMINPGSHIAESREGQTWTNTEEKARELALEYWAYWRDVEGGIRAEWMDEIEMLPGSTPTEGRWEFRFRHKVTGKVCVYETHGIHPEEEYMKKYIFHPRVYWSGESGYEPKIEDFLADGYRVQTRIVPTE